MSIVSISEKGQVTLPAGARRKLGIRPRSRVDIDVRGDEIVIRPVKSIRDVRGIFSECAQGKSVDWEEVRRSTQAAVADEVSDEAR